MFSDDSGCGRAHVDWAGSSANALGWRWKVLMLQLLAFKFHHFEVVAGLNFKFGLVDDFTSEPGHPNAFGRRDQQFPSDCGYRV